MMTLSEMAELAGLMFSCFAGGWVSGFLVYSLKRFFEQI